MNTNTLETVKPTAELSNPVIGVFSAGTTNESDWLLANQTARANGPVTEVELAAFVKAISDRVEANSVAEYPTCEANWSRITHDPAGRKYARLVRESNFEPKTGMYHSRGAYCFIDLSNGDILRADGWKSPAKHARGNIRVGNAENWFNNALNQYSATYLR